MQFTSLQNKFLTIKRGAVLTQTIDRVITALEPYFAKEKYYCKITSGLRLPEDQLRIIRQYLVKTQLNHKFPEAMSCGVRDEFEKDGVKYYKWQHAWSALLKAGIIINPPIRAKCLEDYVSNGVNKNGHFINESPHFTGRCFDIGGGDDGIDRELAIIRKAIADKVPGLVGYVIERKNNCLHVDCSR